MATDLKRRAFLRGKPKFAAADVPLPWSNHESITDNCTRCGDCKSICPEKIITIGDGGFPTLDFSQSECSFCGKCKEICKVDVFNDIQLPILQADAKINFDKCLPEKGIHCEACRDSCDEIAISMKMRIGLPPKPQIDITKCTGCGACYKPCPATAIKIEPIVANLNQGDLAHA